MLFAFENGPHAALLQQISDGADEVRRPVKRMAAKNRGVVGVELHQRIEPLLRHFAHVRRPIGGEDQLVRIDVAEANEAERLARSSAAA